jgi:D-3-phosphoglycerate dehydrogenase
MTDLRHSTGRLESHTVDSLILDLLEWMGPTPRPYAEVLEAWRTSCPRLPVWEEANDRGFIARHRAPGGGALVSVSAAGRSTCGSTVNGRRADASPR